MRAKFKLCLVLLVAFATAQEVNYRSGEILVHFKNDIVMLPHGEQQGGIECIQGSGDLQIYLNALEVQEVRKVFPDFSSRDTLVTLEDGIRVKIPNYANVVKLVVPAVTDIPAVCESLSAFSEILYAQPNYLFHMEATPNDTYFHDQWSLEQDNNCDIDAPQAWDIETGNYGIKIGILDIGVQYDHEDLGNGFGLPYVWI